MLTRNKIIFIGLGLLSLLFLIMLAGRLERSDLDKNIIGAYSINGKNDIVLRLNNDKTFQSFGIDSLLKVGNGTWDILLGDFYTVCLNFENRQGHSCDGMFHVQSSDDKIDLLDPFGSTILTKEKHSH